MDPTAALRLISDADRVDANTREVMRELHQWLTRGGFQPDWERYPKGTRRFRKKYGKRHGLRMATSTRRKASTTGRTQRARLHETHRSSRHHETSRRSGLAIGDVVQRSDVDGKNRYVITEIRGPWIYTRRISGSGTPGIITFPSELMLRKVG